MASIRVRREIAEQAEYLRLEECALLLRVSKATIRRRLRQLEQADGVARSGRIVRVRRTVLMSLFQPGQ